MTSDNLKEVMRIQLGYYNRHGLAISDDTIHDQILSATDGIGGRSSKELYKNSIRWTIRTEGYLDEPWAQNWISMTITQLAGCIYKPKV